MKSAGIALFCFLWLPLLALPAGSGQDRALILQSTTSISNSGLYDYLLPRFTKATGIAVKAVAVGTGQALRNARRCDGDVLLVHAKMAELSFVADGHGVARHDLMYNHFVILGPASDPAGVSRSVSAKDAYRRIAQAGKAGKRLYFISRGDDSGTHRKSLALWRSAGIEVSARTHEWYREVGAGMGATLNIAGGLNGYTLSDRGTWLRFSNKGKLRILFEGDPVLFNQYGIIQVSAEKCPNVRHEAAERFVAWMLSREGQNAIGGFRWKGEPLFFPNAAHSRAWRGHPGGEEAGPEG